MLFMACLVTYMLRVNMSVNILAMVTNGTAQPDVCRLERRGGESLVFVLNFLFLI